MLHKHPKGRHRRVRRHRQWLSKGFWAVTDQGLFALTNFAISVLLARWLPPSDYGAFAVAFSVLLLMGTIHTALLTEPMLVFGPSRYSGRTASYVDRLTTMHFSLATGMSVVLLLVVVMLTRLEPRFTAAATLIALAVSAPGILFLWLIRRACYIESDPRLAATTSLAYAILVSTGMFLLTQVGVLTAGSSLVTLGICSLLVGWWLKRRLARPSPEAITEVSISSTMHVHWTYGRWALASGLLSWVPANAVVLVLPLWYSLEDAGTLRVATTLMLPVLHVVGALGPLLTPALVRARFSGQLRSMTMRTGIFFVGLGMVYAPIILTLGSQLSELLFGTQYRIEGPTLWLIAAIPPVTAISFVAGAVLRALERPDQVLWTYVASTAVTLVVGLPLVFVYGVDGALASLLLSAATTAIVGTGASRRLIALKGQPTGGERREWPDEPVPGGAPALGGYP